MIKINDVWILKADGYGYALMQDTLTYDKKGNKHYKTWGYFSNLKSALKAYVQKRLIAESFESELTLREVRGLLEIIEREIKEVVG